MKFFILFLLSLSALADTKYRCHEFDLVTGVRVEGSGHKVIVNKNGKTAKVYRTREGIEDMLIRELVLQNDAASVFARYAWFQTSQSKGKTVTFTNVHGPKTGILIFRATGETREDFRSACLDAPEEDCYVAVQECIRL
jgi:predicted NBD/HSP70 family sugar kinase